MARFDLLDIKKQASLFFREKFMDARLALTDVSRIQLLTEEATNADPWGPETKTLAMLSDAAYELEEYDRIVPVLQSRLEMIEKKPWKQVHKTLVVLEYLLTHGPGSLLHDFRSVMVSIEELCQFTFVDHQGVDRGLSIRKMADRVLELLCKTEVWKEERNRARKISYEIKGFGSNSMKEKTHVAFDNMEHQVRSEDSVAEDAESPSAVISPDQTAANEESKAAIEDTNVSAAIWHPFEKCVSSPMHFRESDSRFPSSHEFNPRMHDEHNNELLAVWGPVKKTMSSPGFRDVPLSAWQPFGGEIVREVDDAGADVMGSTHDEDHQLLQVSEAHVQRAGKDETLTVDMDVPMQRGKTVYRNSIRHMFGLQRSPKDSIQMNSPEKHAASKSVAGSIKSSDSRISVQSCSKVDGSRGIDFTASEYVNKLPLGEERQLNHGSSKLPALPPPPHPGFRAKIQRHLQLPSLIDL